MDFYAKYVGHVVPGKEVPFFGGGGDLDNYIWYLDP